MNIQIPRPEQPVEEEHENVDDQPDLAHTWDKDGWEVGYCDGLICSVCGFSTECRNCARPVDVSQDMSCLREQADNRNIERRSRYMKRLDIYQAELSYYNRILEHNGLIDD